MGYDPPVQRVGGPIARRFELELNTVRDSLLRMAGRVEQMIAESGRALVDRDVELAKRVIALDQEVNRYEVDIDELCLQVLAKGQLAAANLRFVTLAMKMVTDLERIADLAVNISERAIDLASAQGIVVHPDLPSMSVRVQEMVHLAIDAFVDRDVSKAREVIARDDEVDDLYHVVFEDQLGRMHKDPARLNEWIHVQSVAKWLERMGDHSTNLAELVIFMVEGRDVRHPKLHEARDDA